MTVFKAFLKVLNKCKFTVIMYTIILVAFAGFQLESGDSATDFSNVKPSVTIINQDENTGITENFINYITDNCTIKTIDGGEEAIDDALFYRDVNYVIYIPKNFNKDFAEGKTPEIEVKSTGTYQASYAEMLVSKYIKTADICREKADNIEEVSSAINDILSTQAKVNMTSKLDTDSLAKMALYYNFANYSILAGCVFVICLILASFKEEKINKRIMISSMNYKKHNLILLLSNMLFAVVLWALYVGLSFVLLGDAIISAHGLVYIANSFVFTICSIAIAFFIASIVTNKNAINGIVNVVALGSSFLCGAFVPVEMLPDGVLKAAHILPSYWYINSNELLKTMEKVNVDTLKPVFVNMAVILAFAVAFVVLANIFTKKKVK